MNRSSGDTAAPVGKNSSSGLGLTSSELAVHAASARQQRTLLMGTVFDRQARETVAQVKSITACLLAAQLVPPPPGRSAPEMANMTRNQSPSGGTARPSS